VVEQTGHIEHVRLVAVLRSPGPLGARILSVVDYFDALMSERPYHKAMSLEAAVGLLRQESGKALDPRVVTTFIDMYATLAAEAEASQEPSRKLTRVPTHAPTAAPAVGLVHESSSAVRTNIFQDIALAHREIYALYEIAQAMGSSLGVADTMALISSKLSNIVPFSCCALFLYNDETEFLRCRFATGVEADVIQQLTIRNGQGLTYRPLDANERPRSQQWNVTVENQRGVRVVEQRNRLLHCVSGAQLRFLHNEPGIGFVVELRTDLIGAISDDHDDACSRVALCCNSSGRLEYMG